MSQRAVRVAPQITEGLAITVRPREDAPLCSRRKVQGETGRGWGLLSAVTFHSLFSYESFILRRSLVYTKHHQHCCHATLCYLHVLAGAAPAQLSVHVFPDRTRRTRCNRAPPPPKQSSQQGEGGSSRFNVHFKLKAASRERRRLKRRGLPAYTRAGVFFFNPPAGRRHKPTEQTSSGWIQRG